MGLVAATTTAVTTAAAATTVAAATATTAASAAAVAAATATTAATEAAAACTGGTCFHWASFVHYETTATVLLTVYASDSCLSFCIAAHFHKAEAFGATCVTFHHDFGAGNRTVRSECLLQIFVTERIRQVAYVKFVAHVRTPQNNSKRDGVQTAINKPMKTKADAKLVKHRKLCTPRFLSNFFDDTASLCW
jgi:hypothetical protein